MIPKIIHYCWFGRNPKPEFVLKYIQTWRNIMPDYEIKEWNEDNYNITKCQYMADAYKEKKWAFVSDYARIDVIYQNGGIYLDTDVEVVKNFDDLLKEDLFCGFESRDPLMDKYKMNYEESVNLGLGYGAIKGHKVLKDILELYNNLSFYNQDGSLNLIACPHYQTKILMKYGLIPNRNTQRFDSGIAFSPEYFCPQSNLTDKILYLTSNTYSIHHFSATWTKSTYGQIRMKNFLRNYIGYKYAAKLSYYIFKILKLFNNKNK